MGGLPKIRTPGAQPTAASCPRNQDHDLSDVRGWAEIAHRPPKLRDRSRNRRSPHDGHGAANAVDRMHRRTRSRRRNVPGAACETGMTEEIWAHLPPATAAGSQAGWARTSAAYAMRTSPATGTIR